MGKLQDFFMEGNVGEVKTAEVMISPFPHPFSIHSITEAEEKAVRKSCRKVGFDKKTRQKTVENDSDLYLSRLIVSCCSEPNFKDAKLQERYGVVGAEELLETLLTPGQYSDLLTAVQELNGFSQGMDDLVDEAKN